MSQTSSRVQELEGELETVRRVALDLQEEAEGKLNEMLALKASVSAKEYDLESKSDLISTLQQEVSAVVVVVAEGGGGGRGDQWRRRRRIK